MAVSVGNNFNNYMFNLKLYKTLIKKLLNAGLKPSINWNKKLSNQWSTNIGFNYTKGEGYFEQFKDDRDAADYNNLINDGSDVILVLFK